MSRGRATARALGAIVGALAISFCCGWASWAIFSGVGRTATYDEAFITSEDRYDRRLGLRDSPEEAGERATGWLLVLGTALGLASVGSGVLGLGMLWAVVSAHTER